MAVSPVVGEPFDKRADGQDDDADEQERDELPGIESERHHDARRPSRWFMTAMAARAVATAPSR